VSLEKPLSGPADTPGPETEFEYPPGTQLFTPEQINQIVAAAHSFGITEADLIKEALEHHNDDDAFAAVQAYVRDLLKEI
jgi:hypothetical protein